MVSGSTPRAAARSSVSSWKGTMSTTGWLVGSSVTSQPIASSAVTAWAARGAARPSPSSTKQRTVSSIAARWPCRSSSSRCASAARWTPSRSFKAASCAVGQSRPAPVTRNRSCSLTGSRSPARRSATASESQPTSWPRIEASVATAQVYDAVWQELSSTSGVQTITSSARFASSLSDVPVTSTFGPGNARAASTVMGVPPSWLTSTSMSAAGGDRRHSSASIPSPVVWAAWKEVPHPTASTRPVGRSGSVGTWASQAGCAATPRAIFSPATGASIPWPGMGVFERETLSNGLRVLTAPMPQAQSVSCFVMLAAGSRYETPETNGIAHFAEHMFFKGTERRPTARDIAGEIDSIGGEFNAFTGKEYTGYYVRCAAETRDTALDVLVDMLRHSRFDADEIEREKGVIVEEMNMYFDTPRDFIGGVYESLLYGDQPLGWDIIGRKETVRGATRETFTDYLERWYRPERMVVGIGGRIGNGLRERLEELLGDLEPRETGRPPAVVLGENGSRVKVHTKQSDQAHIVLGVRSRPLVDPDRYVLQLLATVLGGGMSSRLFTEVRERRGLAYYVFGTNHAYTDAGSLYAQSGVDINRIDDAVSTIVEQFRLLASEPVPADELEKARNFTKGRFVLQLESPHGTIMFGLRREVLEGRAEEPQAVLDALDAVTAEDVQRVAGDVLRSGFHLAVIGPFEDAERFERLLR